jgi:ribose transport system substrate-binding protein
MNQRKSEIKIEMKRAKSFCAQAVFVLGVLPACAILPASCGRGAKPEARRPDPTAGGKAPRIVVIAGAPDGNWKAARRGAVAAGTTFGADIEWHAPVAKKPKGATPVQQQEKWIEEATKSNASGIAVAPIDATKLVPAINKAGKNFVPALAFDAPAYTKYKLTWVKNDDRAAGVLAARHAAKIAGGAGRVWFVPAKADSGGAQSTIGFEESLKKEFPAMQVSAVGADALLQAGVLYAPDEETSRAVLKIISPATKLIAVGCSADLIAGLKNGKINALIVPDRYEMAYRSVQAILEYRQHNPPKTEIEIAPVLVTKDELQNSRLQRVLGIGAGDVQ